MALPFNKLVIASGNKGKIREIAHVLAPLNIEIVSQSEFNVPECPEPYGTFIENALAKARHASEHTGLPALADDSGLCVNALQGAPGLISARYAGPQSANSLLTQDERNNDKLLTVMSRESDRRAYFYSVLVLVRSPQDPQPILMADRARGTVGRLGAQHLLDQPA